MQSHDGSWIVADQYNNRIRKVAVDGTVSTLAGSVLGYSDGDGETALFNAPSGVDVCPDGGVVVADSGNRRLRRIAPDGTVSTVVAKDSKFKRPYGACGRPSRQCGVARTSAPLAQCAPAMLCCRSTSHLER